MTQSDDQNTLAGLKRLARELREERLAAELRERRMLMTQSDDQKGKSILADMKRLAAELRERGGLQGDALVLPCTCKVTLGNPLGANGKEPGFTASPCDEHASQLIAELLCSALGLN